MTCEKRSENYELTEHTHCRTVWGIIGLYYYYYT